MAGAIAETRFGIPDDIKNKARTYLPSEILFVMDKMYSAPVLVKSDKNRALNQANEKIKD